MDIYLSISPKFFVKEPHELINQIIKEDVNHIVKGIEILFNFDSKEQTEYVSKLTYLCSKSGYKVQFHTDTKNDLVYQKEYLDFINSMSKYFNGERLIVVYHSTNGEDLEDVVKSTNIFISELLNYIYMNRLNIKLSLENLDDKSWTVRLDKEEMKEILYNNEDLYFTYDICHEIIEYGSITNVDYLLEQRLNNVHLHSYDEYSQHVPIKDNDEHKLKWLKALTYLKLIDYRGAICLEYEYSIIDGNSFEEKIHNFIVSAEYVDQHLEKD